MLTSQQTCAQLQVTVHICLITHPVPCMISYMPCYMQQSEEVTFEDIKRAKRT